MRGERLGWRDLGLGLTALTLGIGIGRLLGERGRSASAARVPGADRLGSSSVPMESWRGSGLAEDVGVPRHTEDGGLDEGARQRRMREAQEQLGLPDPDTRAT